MKRALPRCLTALLLMFVLLLLCLPVQAESRSGATGDCTWVLDGTKLTVSGNGAMGTYNNQTVFAPWGTDITEVVVESGVTTIGNFSFFQCRNLTKVSFSDTVTVLGDGCFYGCSSLAEIVIPDAVRRIPKSAFCGAASLVRIHWPQALTSIGDYAFYGTALTDISLPEGVSSLGNRAFANSKALKTVVFPESLTKIDVYAFDGCRSLESVTVGHRLSMIGENAFRSCDLLTLSCYPDSYAASYAAENGIQTSYRQGGRTGKCYWTLDGTRLLLSGNGQTADYDAGSPAPWGTEITAVTVEKGVTSIGKNAFFNCTALTEVALADTVTSIGSCAFYHNTSLTEIAFPTALLTIGEDAFYHASALTGIVLPKGTETVEKGAFLGCDALTFAVLPQSVTAIGAYAFSGCDQVTLFSPKNSFAASYAAENGIRYQTMRADTASAGDVDRDGSVSQTDRVLLARHLAGWGGETDAIDKEAADVNGDGDLGSTDRTILARYLAEWGGEYDLYFS